MKTASITDPTWSHIVERDKQIRRMSALLCKMAKKGYEGILTPEDMDAMLRAATSAEKCIGPEA